MANTFKNKLGAGIGTSESIVYTVPSSTTTTVVGLSVANVTSSNITVDIRVFDTSASTHAHIIKTGDVFKPESYNKPAKHVRYNLLDNQSRQSMFEKAHYAGGYLYLS